MQETVKIAEKGKPTGSFVIRQHKAGKIRFRRDEKGRAIPDLGDMKAAMAHPDYEHPRVKNLIVSSSGYGRNLLLRQMSADTTYPIVVDSAAIGTSNTAPADAQTGLIAEVLNDIPVSLYELADDVLVLSFFIPDMDLANDDYFEFGLFMNGRLFARALISPEYTKSSGIDTTFEYTITFST